MALAGCSHLHPSRTGQIDLHDPLPMKPLYAILYVPTGFFLSEPVGRYGRGGSHVEPVNCSGNEPNPRLFQTERSAKAALTQWLRGKHMCSRGYHTAGIDEMCGEYFEETEIVPQPHRKRNEMLVIPFNLQL